MGQSLSRQLSAHGTARSGDSGVEIEDEYASTHSAPETAHPKRSITLCVSPMASRARCASLLTEPAPANTHPADILGDRHQSWGHQHASRLRASFRTIRRRISHHRSTTSSHSGHGLPPVSHEDMSHSGSPQPIATDYSPAAQQIVESMEDQFYTEQLIQNSEHKTETSEQDVSDTSRERKRSFLATPGPALISFDHAEELTKLKVDGGGGGGHLDVNRPKQLKLSTSASKPCHQEELSREVIWQIIRKFPFASPKTSPRASPGQRRRHPQLHPASPLIEQDETAADTSQSAPLVDPNTLSLPIPNDTGPGTMYNRSPSPSAQHRPASAPTTPTQPQLKRANSLRNPFKQRVEPNEAGLYRYVTPRKPFLRQKSVGAKSDCAQTSPHLTKMLREMVLEITVLFAKLEIEEKIGLMQQLLITSTKHNT